ncbi:YheC/YheD family protein [Paenibacillus elgii]
MKKHREILQHSVLRRHLPETLWFTYARALRMLRSYSTIFIKPNYGSGGNGVIRVNKVRNGYEVRKHTRRFRLFV